MGDEQEGEARDRQDLHNLCIILERHVNILGRHVNILGRHVNDSRTRRSGCSR